MLLKCGLGLFLKKNGNFQGQRASLISMTRDLLFCTYLYNVCVPNTHWRLEELGRWVKRLLSLSFSSLME